MRRLSRVWKLYIVYTVLLMAALTAGGFLLQGRLEDRLTLQCSENGLVMARLVAEALACQEVAPEDIPIFSERLGLAAGVRISILDDRGRVQGDSSPKVSVGDSRIGRPEIESAAAEGFGYAVRRSTSVGVDFCYVALRAESIGKIVRVGIPLESVTKLKNDVAVLFSLVLYLTPVLIVGAVFFVARRLASTGGRRQGG